MENGLTKKATFLMAHLQDLRWDAAAQLVGELIAATRTEAMKEVARENVVAAQADMIGHARNTVERLARAIIVWPKEKWTCGMEEPVSIGALSDIDLEHALQYLGNLEQSWAQPSVELEALMIEKESRRRKKEEAHADHE